MELCEAKAGRDAWESMNGEGLCGTPWKMVAELRLTQKVTADKKERDLHYQGLWLKERPKLNPEDSTCCRLTLKLTDTLEAAQDVQHLHRMEKRQSHKTAKAVRESERSLRELSFIGKARMNAYKDRVAETERVKETRKNSS